jgi:hypothetical protein
MDVDGLAERDQCMTSMDSAAGQQQHDDQRRLSPVCGPSAASVAASATELAAMIKAGPSHVRQPDVRVATCIPPGKGKFHGHARERGVSAFD